MEICGNKIWTNRDFVKRQISFKDIGDESGKFNVN